MTDYKNVKDLNLEQKEEHCDRYDKLDLSAIDGPDVEQKEGHDRVENPDSTRQTPVVQANESKRSTDKSMERDYVTLVEKGPGKVPSTVEKRPTSSLIPNRTRKKKEMKRAPQIETTDKDEYDSLYQSAIKDSDLDRSRKEEHDRVEGRHSTRQTPTVQSIESKRSTDKAMERDYVKLVEKGPGKVPAMDGDSRPTSSLIPSRTGKKTENKKAPQLEITDKDDYDSLDRSATEDLDLERSEGHDTVEGRHSTLQTTAVQSIESKRSTDKAMEWDYVTLVENRPGKVPSMDADSRPTSSLIQSRAGKKTVKKKAPQLETTDKDEYDSLYLSAIKDLDLDRSRKEEHGRVKGRLSTRQTPAVQSIESKCSTDKAMERDSVTLVEKGQGKVQSMDADSRPTSSLIPSRTGKKKENKKAPQLELPDKHEYDSLYRSAIEDLDLDRSQKEGHDRVEDPDSTWQTPVAQVNESKRSTDKTMERDNGNLVEKGPGEVPRMDAVSRPTSSLTPSGAGKKKVTKKAAKLETSDQDLYGYEELDRYEAVFSSAQASIALQPIVKCQKPVEKTWGYEELPKVTNLTFGEEKAVFDWDGSQGLERSNVRALQASIAELDCRLSTIWRSILILSTLSICAVVIAIVALYIAMASSSGGDDHLQFRSDRTNTSQGTNGKLGEGPITSWKPEFVLFCQHCAPDLGLSHLVWQCIEYIVFCRLLVQG